MCCTLNRYDDPKYNGKNFYRTSQSVFAPVFVEKEHKFLFCEPGCKKWELFSIARSLLILSRRFYSSTRRLVDRPGKLAPVLVDSLSMQLRCARSWRRNQRTAVGHSRIRRRQSLKKSFDGMSVRILEIRESSISDTRPNPWEAIPSNDSRRRSKSGSPLRFEFLRL